MRQLLTYSVDDHIPSLDRDPSTTRHGVPRIDDEVEDRCFELRWIDPCRGQNRAQDYYLDLLAYSPTYQVFDISD